MMEKGWRRNWFEGLLMLELELLVELYLETKKDTSLLHRPTLVV